MPYRSNTEEASLVIA